MSEKSVILHEEIILSEADTEDAISFTNSFSSTNFHIFFIPFVPQNTCFSI